MKREYTKPEITIQVFTTEDIITTSSLNTTPKLPVSDDNTTVIDGSIFNQFG